MLGKTFDEDIQADIEKCLKHKVCDEEEPQEIGILSEAKCEHDEMISAMTSPMVNP
jgi:hypothetical protein